MRQWVLTRWALLIFLTLGMGKWYYPTTLLVTKVESGIVTLRSREGNTYTMEEDLAWRPGDKAECIMHTNRTEDKVDDQIIDYIYIWEKRK